jgi:hypothetical protein
MLWEQEVPGSYPAFPTHPSLTPLDAVGGDAAGSPIQALIGSPKPVTTSAAGKGFENRNP